MSFGVRKPRFALKGGSPAPRGTAALLKISPLPIDFLAAPLYERLFRKNNNGNTLRAAGLQQLLVNVLLNCRANPRWLPIFRAATGGRPTFILEDFARR